MDNIINTLQLTVNTTKIPIADGNIFNAIPLIKIHKAHPIILYGIVCAFNRRDNIQASTPPTILPTAIAPCEYPYSAFATSSE